MFFYLLIISDDPVPGCAPLELLQQGKFVAGQETFNILRPYLEYVVEVNTYL